MLSDSILVTEKTTQTPHVHLVLIVSPHWIFSPLDETVCFKYITINLNHNRIPGNPVYAPEIRIVEIKNGKYDNEIC